MLITIQAFTSRCCNSGKTDRLFLFARELGWISGIAIFEVTFFVEDYTPRTSAWWTQDTFLSLQVGEYRVGCISRSHKTSPWWVGTEECKGCVIINLIASYQSSRNMHEGFLSDPVFVLAKNYGYLEIPNYTRLFYIENQGNKIHFYTAELINSVGIYYFSF